MTAGVPTSGHWVWTGRSTPVLKFKDDAEMYEPEETPMTDEVSPKKKVCTKCSDPKPLSEYSEDKRRPDGLKSWCRDCVKNYMHTYNRRDRSGISPDARAIAAIQAALTGLDAKTCERVMAYITTWLPTKNEPENEG